LIVGYRRHFLGGDNHHLFAHTTAYVGCGSLQGNDESRAGSLYVITECIGDAGFPGDDRCRGGEAVVGGRGGAYDSVNFAGVSIGLPQYFFYGSRTHFGTAQTFAFQYVAGLDTYAGGNPLVGGIDHFR